MIRQDLASLWAVICRGALPPWDAWLRFGLGPRWRIITPSGPAKCHVADARGACLLLQNAIQFAGSGSDARGTEPPATQTLMQVHTCARQPGKPRSPVILVRFRLSVVIRCDEW
jgi:hypothetical protein